MTTISDIILADLAARSNWGSLPELRLVLTGEDGEPQRGNQSVIPPWYWAMGPVPVILHSIAEHFGEERARFTPEAKGSGCQGLTFYSEVWMVEVPQDNVHRVDQVMAATKNLKLGDEPGSVKTRIIMACMADGTEYVARCQQDGKPELVDLEDKHTLIMDERLVLSLRTLRDVFCEPA